MLKQKSEKVAPFFLLIAIFLVSCGTQTRMPGLDENAIRAETEIQERAAKAESERKWKEVVDKWLEDSKEIEEIASKIFTRGAKYCEKREHIGPYTGIRSWSKYDFEDKWHEAALTKFGLTDGVHLFLVTPSSPAEAAGLKNGDIVLEVNNQPIQRGKNAVADFDKKIREIAKVGDSIELTIRRGETRHVVSVTPSAACKSRVFLNHDPSVNAHADGENIVIHKGMKDFFVSPDEIALIISHELAHNSMQHSLVKRINGTMLGGVGILLGTAVDIGSAMLIGGAPTNMLGWELGKLGYEAGLGVNSVELEREADYVALYFMALAGYEIEVAPLFWRRLADLDPTVITMRSSHPTSVERFVGMEATVKEIKGKKLAGLPTWPEQSTLFDFNNPPEKRAVMSDKVKEQELTEGHVQERSE